MVLMCGDQNILGQVEVQRRSHLVFYCLFLSSSLSFMKIHTPSSSLFSLFLSNFSSLSFSYLPSLSLRFSSFSLSPSFSLSSSSKQNLFLLRLLLFSIIILTGIIGGIFSFYLIRSHERTIEENHFESAIKANYHSIKQSLDIKLQMNIQLAIQIGMYCRSQSNWPNCSFSSEEFLDLNTALMTGSDVEVFSFLPIVTEENRESFEHYAHHYYQTDGAYSPGTGSQGITTCDKNSQIIPSVLSNSSEYQIFTPVFQVSNTSSYGSLMYDTHSDPSVERTIDEILNCLSLTRHEKNMSEILSHSEMKFLQRKCSGLADFIPTFTEKSSMLLTPIFPYDEPNSVVGFSVALYSWENILIKVAQKESTFSCIIRSSTTPDTEASYQVSEGNVRPSTQLHLNRNRHYIHSFVINQIGEFPSCTQYSIIYSTIGHKSRGTIGIVACVCCVGMSLLISIIFGVFNIFIEKEAKKARDLLDSKRIFVRFISHEIRTPLNTIILGLRILQEDILSLQDPKHSPSVKRSLPPTPELALKESLELIRDLEENSSIAVATLNDLMNYDKIESKTFTIENKYVNIWKVVKKTIHPLTLQAHEKGINIVVDLQDSRQLLGDSPQFQSLNLHDLCVWGDSIKLSQVVRNLVSNALKFSPRGGEVTVTVQFQPTILPSPSIGLIDFRSKSSIVPSTAQATVYDITNSVGDIVITVKDSGPGLSTEQQKTLFQPGVQFNANQLQAGQGSGLGLWISREIVSLHSGEISVKSAGLGQGAIFEVRLPAKWRDSNEIEPLTLHSRQVIHPINPSPHPQNPPQNHQNQNHTRSQQKSETITDQTEKEKYVLVVDDANSNRKLICRILRGKGYICHEAEDGEKCLEAVNTHLIEGKLTYDFILLDYEMPILNGPLTAKELRASYPFSDLLIIGVTGNVLLEDVNYFMKNGANIVFPKPVKIDQVLEYVENASASSQV